MVSLSIVPLSYKSRLIFLLVVVTLLINLFSLPNKTQGSVSSLLLPGLLLPVSDSLLTSLVDILVSESFVAGKVLITMGSARFTTGALEATDVLMGVCAIAAAPSFLIVTGALMLVGAGDFSCVEVFVFVILFPTLFAIGLPLDFVIIVVLDSFVITTVLGFLATTEAVVLIALLVLFAAMVAIGVFSFFASALLPVLQFF